MTLSCIVQVKVNGQTFQDWFIHSYMLNKVGSDARVSGFFWDDGSAHRVEPLMTIYSVESSVSDS